MRWCAADEGLCVAATEHVMLTCIEKGISLGSFTASEIIEALQAASDDLSCALVTVSASTFQYAICSPLCSSAVLTEDVLHLCNNSMSSSSSPFQSPVPGNSGSHTLVAMDWFQAIGVTHSLNVVLCRAQLGGAGSGFLWHVLRLHTSLKGPAVFATRDSDLQDPGPAAHDPQIKLAFDKALVSRACMQAALGNICSDTQGDPGSGSVRVVLSEVQPAWEDSFPALHHWRKHKNGAAQHNMEQEAEDEAERQDLLLEGLKGLAVVQSGQSAEQRQEVLVLFESRLPKEAAQRFKALLQVIPVWSREQMEPYLDVCDAECANATELLLKYTRTIRDGSGNQPTYVAR